MSRIELNSIRKSYGDTEIIKGVDITIEEGEFAVFVGPSGCGKSTLLRMVAGLESISAGDLILGGQRMNDVPPDKRGIAMVFQSYALYPHMTVAENIGFALSLKKVAKNEIKNRVREVGKILHLEDLLNRKPAELSGGQRQRVAIGRAIVKKPRVILFDEPLSNLDAMLRVQMRAEIQKLHQEFGSTIIYVTHDQVEAMTMAEKIVVLNQGRVAQTGHPISLYKQPQNTFVAEFIGSPKMNLIELRIDQVYENHLELTDAVGSRFTLAGVYNVNTGDIVKLGIRPEHISIAEDAASADLVEPVAIVERLGAETYVHLHPKENAAAQSTPIVLRVEGDCQIRQGDKLGIVFDRQHCLLFDADGGKRGKGTEKGTKEKVEKGTEGLK